jgi:arsenate reductase
MAAALLRHRAGDRFEVYSAGTRPSAEIHPLAVRVMAEIGLNIANQRPQCVGELFGRILVRYLIITCDQANEECPRIFPYMVERLFWPFDDPNRCAGGTAEKLAQFRTVRDQIDGHIQAWLGEIANRD